MFIDGLYDRDMTWRSYTGGADPDDPAGLGLDFVDLERRCA